MKLDGIHHVTAITADAQRNVDFFAGVLGLRLVKKSVNQDQTSVYHLLCGRERRPRLGHHLLRVPPAASGPSRRRDDSHRRVRLASGHALDFWERRLADAGYDAARGEGTLAFSDFEGLGHELRVVQTPDEPLIAHHPAIPAELAIHGFDAVRAYSDDPERSRGLLEDTLGFASRGMSSWEARGDRRGGEYVYDEPPKQRALQGAGTVHHVAWATPPEDEAAWQQRVAASGARPTPIIDRHYFRSVYFREPSGVLFEIGRSGRASPSMNRSSTGEKLSLTPQYEHLRDQIEPRLTPLVNPPERWALT